LRKGNKNIILIEKRGGIEMAIIKADIVQIGGKRSGKFLITLPDLSHSREDEAEALAEAIDRAKKMIKWGHSYDEKFIPIRYDINPVNDEARLLTLLMVLF